MLEFRAADHSYRWDGRRVPSVTQILRASGLCDPGSIDPWYLERGTMIHLACEIDDKAAQGLGPPLDESSLDPRIAGYLASWRLLREMGPEWREWEIIEAPLYSERIGVAGTVDRVGHGRIIDIKSGGPEHYHGLQLAGYGLLLDDGSLERLGVYLDADGGLPRVRPYTDLSDAEAFCAAVHLWRWRERNRLNKEDPCTTS